MMTWETEQILILHTLIITGIVFVFSTLFSFIFFKYINRKSKGVVKDSAMDTER